jgi:glycosyltransferase involved in cell wall biosynthesis
VDGDPLARRLGGESALPELSACMKLVIIVPAFNEEKAIGKLIEEILATPLPAKPRIYVIDDGSSDNTAREARRAGARVVRLVQNLGYGNALRAGYKIALSERADVAVQMDGDGQHAPASIPDLIRPLLAGECDLAVGSRAHAKSTYAMPLARRAGQRLFAWLLESMSGLRIGDPTSGFQAMGARVLDLYATDDFPGDYPDTDMLLYLRLHGAQILEVPAEFRASETGQSMHSGILKPAYYVYKMLFAMALVYARHRGNRGTSRHSPRA